MDFIVIQNEIKFINAGTFQEYDYTCEDAECEWKQVTEYWRK
jgi:hypothetical protein